jgi:hypothetical protein
VASKTKKLEYIRKHKQSTRGTKRKASLRTNGSTKSAKELFAD